MPDTNPPTADAPTRILDAAEAIVRRAGVAALTLEAAAKGAGVSKGGLLYHFASKEALLNGLLLRLAREVEVDFEAQVASLPPGPGQATRALLRWSFDLPETMCELHARTAAVFLAAFHHDPALLDPMREVMARVRARLRDDGLPPGISFTVLAACDGLFMAQIFDLYRLEEPDAADIRASLLRLLECLP